MKAADELARQGQHVAAAEQYASAMSEDPLGISSQDAALRAGTALVAAKQFAGALPFYDAAVSIADVRASETRTADAFWLKWGKREALLQRAAALQLIEDRNATAGAWQATIDKIFEELASETRSPTMNSQNAHNLQTFALLAARTLEEHGDFDSSSLAYDYAISIGDSQVATADERNATPLRDTRCEALLGKAGVCQKAGCPVEGSAAIQRLRLEYPAASGIGRMAVIEASLNGWPTADAEQWATRELQAGLLWNDGCRLTPAERVNWADHVVSLYPDTAAALTALDTKGQLLADLQRYDEALSAFTEVLNRLHPTCSNSEFFQTVRARLRKVFWRSIVADLKAGRPVSDQRWGYFRSVCSEIAAEAGDPDPQACAWIDAASSYARQGLYPESAVITEQFLAKLDPDEFAVQTARVHASTALSIVKQAPGAVQSGDPSGPMARVIAEALQAAMTAPPAVGGTILADLTKGVFAAAGASAALAFCDGLLDALGGSPPPHLLAKAKLMRSWALSWNGRHEEAIQSMRALADQFADSMDQNVHWVCAEALCHAYVHAAIFQSDDPAGAYDLATVRLRFPDGRYNGTIGHFTGLVQRRLTPASSQPTSQ
jgi:tetratricopeptide (TPR) repeat protein